MANGDNIPDVDGETRTTHGAEYSILIPELEDAEREYPIPLCSTLPPEQDKEIVALACGSYLGPDVGPYNSHRQLVRQLTADYGNNFWNIPSQPRLPYPYSALVLLASMFKTEKQFDKKADWLLWLDDDVIVPVNLMRVLREAADPIDRPFISVLGYDRNPPFRPAVWDSFQAGGVETIRQWDFDRMPDEGLHEVAVTGLCAAIFHRSLFDRVRQPWFAYLPREVNNNGTLSGGANPDAWWCEQCHRAGIPVYVTLDVDITHLGQKMPINSVTAPLLSQLFGKVV